MDRNKAKKVEENGLRLARCCGTCANFEPGDDLWGTCKVITYFHERHQEERHLSVHRYHTCEDDPKGRPRRIGAHKWLPRLILKPEARCGEASAYLYEASVKVREA